MERQEAIDIAVQHAQAKNYLIGEVQTAVFLRAAPMIRKNDEWSVVFENRMVPGSSLVFLVSPLTMTAELFVT